jgi:endonuclease/exonuclease/phosphatase family metal-dependent hydrolase
MEKDKSIRLLGFNMGCALRDETYHITRWIQYKPGITDVMQQADCALMALVELRDLPASDPIRVYLTATFPHHHLVYRNYCHWEKSMGMAVLVDTREYHVGNVRVHSITKTADLDRTNIVMFVDVQSKRTGKWITVGATHFPMSEETKDYAVKRTRNLLLGQRHPTLLYGDFNFFDNHNGKEQRQYMMQKDIVDVASPLFTLHLRTLYDTFFIFPPDMCMRKPFSAELYGRLDHVFTRARDFKTTNETSAVVVLSHASRMRRAQRHIVLIRHYLLELVTLVMSVYLIVINKHNYLQYLRAYAVRVRAGHMVVYAYNIFPLCIVAYLLFLWRQVQARVYPPLTTAE